MKRDKAVYKIMLLVVLSLWYNLGYSMYVGNYLGKSFNESGGQLLATDITIQQETIKSLIIKSATYFLRGKANVDLLASELEAADMENLCYPGLQRIVNDAMDNFSAARYYYLELKNRAGVVPYNQEVISKLISFDYDSFLKENGLNSDIYNQVRGYLEKGDVRGIFDRFFTGVENILQLLETIQQNVSYSQAPGINISWKLNQACAQMLLFGQYSSQILHSLI